MARKISPLLIFRLLLKPGEVFQNLSETKPSAGDVFFKLAIWMLALPPIFAYFGSLNFGWRLGATEPLILSKGELAGISIGYFFTLVFGFITTSIVSRWMSVTYKARESLGIHFALIAVIGAPLAVGSVIHLYPDVFVNVLVLVPTLIWSMFLLYRGLPIVLKIEPERGMLMASALIGYLLVAFVSLLGLTVMLWVLGVGPRVGV
jgi:hypothetical protein